MVCAVQPVTITMEPLLLRAPDAAHALGVCRKTLDGLIDPLNGQIPAILPTGPTGTVAVEVSELREFIKRKRASAAADFEARMAAFAKRPRPKAKKKRARAK